VTNSLATSHTFDVVGYVQPSEPNPGFYLARVETEGFGSVDYGRSPRRAFALALIKLGERMLKEEPEL
jgi:hypothetical protein